MSSDRSGESSSTTSPGGRHSLSTSSYQAPSLNSPNISMLKAQLELITHERDMLKKDEKWMSSKRDSVPSYNVKHLDNSFHHRTASDTVQPSSPTNKSGLGGSLSRSHSIASSAEKSSFTPFRLPDSSPSNDRLVHELQLSRKQQADNAKKYDQALTDVEYYHKEFESYRTRYNEVLLDKQRLEQELNSLRLMVEDERKEMSELRRQQQDVLNSEVGESLSIMYGTLLRDYETAKDNYTVVRKRYDDLVATHTASVKKLEQSGDEILQYKKLYQEMLTERNQFKQQCTQAIRQWDQALRERNEYKDALAKVQRKHEEAVKEVNQVISVRIKANKDLKRLTDERNAAMQEYSLIMSERDSVHKEIEKLQDEVLTQKKLVSSVESQSKLHDDERKKLYCQIETLKREIDTSLQERDKAIREAHELREKMGMTKNVTESSKSFSSGCSSSGGSKSKFDMEKPRKERESQSAETIEGQHGNANFIKCENLDQANSEIDRLRKLSVKFQSELQDASMEADVAKGRRDMAFSERDKVVLERESIRTLCDKLRRERDRAVSDLAEALRDSDGVKKHRNEIHNENKELRERLEALEKEVRIKSLQRSPGHSHSHDSAIDSDLHEWETENLDIDMNGLGSREDLGLDLSGGRDDVHCPDKPIYISSIYKGSFMDGKLKVNDCILRVNDMDCRDAERDAVLQTLRNSGSAVSLTVRRRRLGRKYTATLHLGGGKESHGLSLDLGVYVVKIQPGSVAAKEGGIAVGDRIISINDSPLDHIRTLSDALKLLNQTKDTLRLTVTKSSSTLSSTTIGPLSSSSSGQNMQEKLAEEDVKVQSPKVASSTMSPIKDTIRGSQEFVKKMLYNPKSGGLASSPSNEKVYYANNGIKSSKQGIMETMKEKIESTVRGRKRSKDHHHNVSNSDMFSNNSFAVHDEGKFRIGSPIEKPLDDEDLAIAELDSVNNYHSGSSGGGTKSSGAEKKKKRSKDRDSFRAGGTWPRARGGPIIELGTGTILHPHKTKRDRLPLAELLSNLPKYPPESSSRVKERTNSSSNRNDESSRSSRKPSRTSGDTGYRRLSRENEEGMQHSCPSKPNSNNAASDTSIDDSVKSAHAGKEVLERYLKKSKSSKTQQQSVLTHSDSDNLSPVMMSPPPPLTLASSTLKMTDSYSAKFDSHHHPVHSLLESGNIIGTSCNTMVSSSVLRSNNNGFGPSSYHGPSNNPVMSTSSILPPHHYGVISSSPRYSSPPPPPSQAQSGDSLILGSPIPDYRNDPNRLSNCEAPQSLSSVSPTPGTFNPSPSPSSGIETVMSRGSQHPRSSSNISSHLPYMHPSSSSVPPGYIQHPHGYSGVSMAQGYRLSEDPASPPHYDYGGVQQRRLGKENNSFSTRISPTKLNMSNKSGTFPRKRKDRDALRNSPKSIPSGTHTLPSKSRSARQSHSGGNSSGTSDRDRSSGSRKSSKRSTREQQIFRARGGLNESSDSSDYDRSKYKLTPPRRRNSRDLLGPSGRSKIDARTGSTTKSPSNLIKKQSHYNSYCYSNADYCEIGPPSGNTETSKTPSSSPPPLPRRGVSSNNPPVTSSSQQQQHYYVNNKVYSTRNPESFEGSRQAYTRRRSDEASRKQRTSADGYSKYKYNIHSSKEVLDFTSNRKRLEEQQQKLMKFRNESSPAAAVAAAAVASVAAAAAVTSAENNNGSNNGPSGIAKDHSISREFLKLSSEILKNSSESLLQQQRHSIRKTSVKSQFDQQSPFETIKSGKMEKKGNDNNHEVSPINELSRTTIAPPDLFNEQDTRSHESHTQGCFQADFDARTRYIEEKKINEKDSKLSSVYSMFNSFDSKQNKSSGCKSKRIRNRSLEMVLDDRPSQSDQSRLSSPKERRPRSRQYSRSLERPKPRRADRIPSNTSVTSHGSATKISSSSIDRSLIKCCSPFPVFNIEYLSADGRISEPPQFTRKPLSGEIRQIYIQKSSEQLGFTIDEGSNKGVFVSSVSEKSLAQLVGLQVGDQLLDVCGINLRSCGKEQAALVLHQVGNTITLKVQYNPEDFLEEDDDDDDEDEEDEDVDVEDDVRADEVLLSSEDEDVDLHRRRRRRRRTSDSPTPRNSPKDSLKHFGPPPSYATLMKHHRINKDKVTAASLHSSPMRGPSVSPPYEPRIVYPTMQKSGDLGVRLVGGNAVGIFIHSIEIDSAAYKVGLRSADQILEYNGVDLRQATAEQAAYELAKPADKVSILVQYNPDKYQVIKDQPGDSYYVRSMFDRLPEYSSPHQLSFSKDDILYIDNTMYNGVPGNWSAWVVDTDGQKRQWGIIPCKYKVEEELLMRRSMGNLDVERRTWTTARRSFFKRKKGTRSGSRDSKELASYSDMGSLSYSDSGNLHEDVQINSYIRVERLDYLVTRPVLIIGPLADAVLDKLISDYPHKFARCEPELMDCDQEALEKGLMDNILIDFRRRGGNRFECTTTQVIKDISDRNQHCILNIHVEAVERLHMNQIYPIVLLIKFKSVKQIREMKDPRYHAEKISQKDAKNIFEHTQKLETEYKHLISDTIHAGANLMLMCAQIASKIEQEQAKTLWVPSGTIW